MHIQFVTEPTVLMLSDLKHGDLFVVALSDRRTPFMVVDLKAELKPPRGHIDIVNMSNGIHNQFSSDVAVIREKSSKLTVEF